MLKKGRKEIYRVTKAADYIEVEFSKYLQNKYEIQLRIHILTTTSNAKISEQFH